MPERPVTQGPSMLLADKSRRRRARWVARAGWALWGVAIVSTMLLAVWLGTR